jgi:hypothetical protein
MMEKTQSKEALLQDFLYSSNMFSNTVDLDIFITL